MPDETESQRAAEPVGDGARSIDAVSAAQGDGPKTADQSDREVDHVGDELLSRLRLIEERPLDERADAYRRIHRELVEAREGDDDHRQDA